MSSEQPDAMVARDVIELVPADAMALRAVLTLPNDGVLGRLILPNPDTGRRVGRPRARMTILVGDLRGKPRNKMLRRMRPWTALSTAVLVVDSLECEELAGLERVFDCVVPVLAPSPAAGDTILADAVFALTAFATANRIGIPVLDMRQLVAIGRAAWGDAADASVVTATAKALETADRDSDRHPKRVVLHVESSERDHLADLQLAAATAYRMMNVAKLALAASARRSSGRSRVSVIVSRPRDEERDHPRLPREPAGQVKT